ncbi:MAG TPA: hypothetical protein VFI65_21675 [Streptosporangiaceae bacterium]|nr:hypothetical protein [Streptosporangiaceae bacterium]
MPDEEGLRLMTHLEIEDLISAAHDLPVSDLDHLAGCGHCQAEVERWQFAAEGLPVPTIVKRRLSVRIFSVVVALLMLISLSPEFIALIR